MVSERCEYCGKPFTPSPGARKQYYCSKECRMLERRDRYNAARREQRAKDRALEKAAHKRTAKGDLDKCMKEANRLGISYGQYMVRREAGLYK